MEPEEFKDFMAAQTEAIEIAKWLLVENLGRDPGPEFVHKCIKENDEEFRKKWPIYYKEWKERHK